MAMGGVTGGSGTSLEEVSGEVVGSEE